MKSLYRLFVLLTFLSAMSAAAQSSIDIVRVRSLERINPAKRYAVLSQTPNGDYCFLSDIPQVEGKPYTKALGIKAEMTAPEERTTVTDDCLWQVTFEQGRVTLSRGDKYLTRKGTGLGLKQSEQYSEEAEWVVSQTAQGDAFLLKASPESTRSLSAQPAKNGLYFDHYNMISDKGAVWLYEADGAVVPPPTGNAERPADGTRVALYGGGKVKGEGGALATDGLTLSDNTLAPADGLQYWTVGAVTDTTFCLKGKDGFLDYNLSTGGAAAWQVRDGLIATVEAVRRYLRFDPNGERWFVTSEPTAGGGVTFMEVAEEPSQTLTKDGVLRLSGGWSREALATLPLENVACLDLTAIVLPRQPGAFEANLDERNMPVFVSESEAANVPATWRFVVRCGKTTNSLVRPVTLKDKAPFFTDRPISNTEDKLIYERAVDTERSPWQTVCLPFRATHDGAQCYKVTAVSGNRLLLENVTFLEAGVAYLFFCEASPLRLVADGATVYPSAPAEGALKGVFQPLTVNAPSENVYLLSPKTQMFVLAAGGSTLAPFRAYIQTDASAKAPLRPLLPSAQDDVRKAGK